jgi:hypothetical protein
MEALQEIHENIHFNGSLIILTDYFSGGFWVVTTIQETLVFEGLKN